jgi:hypothetical protein
LGRTAIVVASEVKQSRGTWDAQVLWIGSSLRSSQ